MWNWNLGVRPRLGLLYGSFVHCLFLTNSPSSSFQVLIDLAQRNNIRGLQHLFTRHKLTQLATKHTTARHRRTIRLRVERRRLISLKPRLFLSMIHHIARVELCGREKLPQTAWLFLLDGAWAEDSKRYTAASPSRWEKKPGRTENDLIWAGVMVGCGKM